MEFVHFTHLSKKGTLSCEKWTKKLFSLSCFKSSRLHLDLKLLAMMILEIIFLLLVSFLLFTQIFENGIPCVKIYYMLSLHCRGRHSIQLQIPQEQGDLCVCVCVCVFKVFVSRFEKSLFENVPVHTSVNQSRRIVRILGCRNECFRK